jgi:tetratricopeptide (TPR) repeat protein
MDHMKSGKLQDQPYQIVYSFASLIGGAAYLYILVIISSIVTYLVFFVPISYQKPDTAHEIWRIGGWTLLLIALLSGIFHISLKIIYNRDICWLNWIAFISNWITICIVFTLNFLGLYPVSAFVPSVLLAISIAYFLLEQLYLLSLRYTHYLSRSITFAEQGAVFLALICSINFLLLFGINVRSVLSSELTPDFVLSIFELISLGIIIYFATNINLNDPRSSRFKTVISITICFTLVIATYIEQGFLSFWWLGMAALSSSIFYTAHSPTKLKSSGTAIGLYSAMSIAVFLDNVTFEPSVNGFWSVIKDLILPILGITVAVIAGGGSLIKTIFPKFRSQKVTKSDVLEASKDFINVHGLSVHSIDQIVKISVLSQDFDFCDNLFNKPESFRSPELREYFEIYYLCAKFSFRGHVKVMVIEPEQAIQQVVINTPDDFTNYINKRFPTYIHDYDIWSGYATKGYITRYVSEKALTKARPKTLYTRFTMYLRNAFIILLVFLTFSSQILTPWLSSLPSVISKLASWNSVRKNEVRLVLIMAMQPFRLDDPSIRDYYAVSIWNWVQNRELYVGEKRNGNFYMPTEAMETQIKYLETIFSFYERRDDFFFKLSNELGGYYKGLGDCNKAFNYFKGVLADSTSIERRDFAIAMSAKCFQKQDLPKAFGLLEEAYQDTGYVQSRSILAEIYYEQGKYSDIIELLNTIQTSLDPVTLSLLGESLYHEGQYANSIDVLESALSNDALANNVDRELHSYLYLGAAYLDTNKPFQSAEYYYKAFSGQICPSTTVLTTDEEHIHIPRYKSAIDLVNKQNPSDYRINLWNFVYFLYNGETENALKFFEAHLNESPDYEQKFSECVINRLKSK